MTDELILSVAKHSGGFAVGVHDLSEWLGDNDAEGADLDRAPQYVVWLQARIRVACNGERKDTHGVKRPFRTLFAVLVRIPRHRLIRDKTKK